MARACGSSSAGGQNLWTTRAAALGCRLSEPTVEGPWVSGPAAHRESRHP